MHGTNWVSLFRRIPANLHDCLALTLTNGMEIVIQRLLNLEPDYAVLRGRMAGTQDAGRVVVVPYSQFLSLAFVKRMTDPEVAAVFGKAASGFPAPVVLSGADDPDAPLDEADDTVTEDEPAAASPRQEMPSKTVLLAKLRARLAK